ncbi:hypothetical protein NC653_018096 [Populus alba x Populus x berolinensis]|uniref:Uncharacterized protein n=1 Tax=Populus alba x Populus x berolinensis TaxID=444605 RepID=A0AAD6QS86_9ROSI|nr:hypothetical protein NC653_018096 [Populus alba x Populus x berolinensis]
MWRCGRSTRRSPRCRSRPAGSTAWTRRRSTSPVVAAASATPSPPRARAWSRRWSTSWLAAVAVSVLPLCARAVARAAPSSSRSKRVFALPNVL